MSGRDNCRLGGCVCPDDESEGAGAETFPGVFLQQSWPFLFLGGYGFREAPEPHKRGRYVPHGVPPATDVSADQRDHFPAGGNAAVPREVRNSNPLLCNMPEVTGLKTGTANKAGACLVTSLAADDGTMAHDLVVVLGTEDSIERGRVSGLLARYALSAFHTSRAEVENDTTAQALPINANAAVDWIFRTAQKD